MKSNYNPRMSISFKMEPWRKTMNSRRYISPCGNYMLKRGSGNLMSGGFKEQLRAELFVLDKNEDWQHVGYYVDSDAAKKAAGYEMKFVSLSGVTLNEAGVKEYRERQKEVA